MATYEFNERIKLVLPPGYLLLRDFDDEGDEVVNIVADEYEDDEGEIKYRQSCRIGETEYDQDDMEEDCSSQNLIDVIVSRMENARLMKMPGVPRTILFNKGMPLSIFGRMIKMYGTMALAQTDEWKLLSLVIAGAYSDTDPSVNADRYEFFFNILKGIRINGDKLPIGNITPSQIEDALQLTFEEEGETIDVTPTINFNFTYGDQTTTYTMTSSGMEKSNEEKLTSVTPDESLYPHYKSIKSAGGFGLFGTVVVNSSGTEYNFIPLTELDNYNVSDDMKSLYKRVIEKDTEYYNLHEKAKKMQKLFHVNSHVFDPRHDRECELEEGYLHRAYMLSGLRSFAWTLADYCKRHNCSPEDIDSHIATWIADFVAGEDWLNYEDSTYCQGLCSGSDLHVYFVPDNISEADRKKLLPSKEDLDRVKQMQSKFPSYREILDEVHSLNELRKDLRYIYPAVQELWNHLEEERDYDEALTGNQADIVYAWCALALAAKGPFYSEDGPSFCFFEQIEDEAAERERLEKEQAERDEAAVEEWMSKYERYVETDPVIDFNGKLFVFSGISSHSYEKDSPIVKKVIEKGGQYRKGVSGITDYLIVDPKHAGKSKIVAVIEQLQKGKNIKVVLLEDLLPYLDIETEKIIPSERKKDSKKEIIYEDYDPYDKTEDLSDFIINDGVLEFYHGSGGHVVIPEGVKSIKPFCFISNNDILSLTLPKSCVIIQNNAFYNMKSLKQIKAKGSIGVIGASAFSDDDILETVDFSNGVERIEDNAFHNCKLLKQVDLGHNIKSMGEGVFKGCGSLETFSFPDCISTIDANFFSGCKNLRSVVFPSNLEKIGEDAFQHCEKLEELELPASLKYLGESAFWGCDSLKRVTIQDGLNAIENNTFSNCVELRNIILSKTIKYIGENAFFGCENLVSIDLPESLEEIGESAFAYCEHLSNVFIPKSVKKIGKWAFRGCILLQKLVIEEGCQEIGEACFDDTRLSEIVLPVSLTSIGINALPDTVIDGVPDIRTTEGSYAEQFVHENIRFLTSDKSDKDTNNAIEKIDGFYLENGTLLGYSEDESTVVIPEGVKSIGKKAFLGKNMDSVIISPGVEIIEESAFSECAKLKEVIISADVKSIGDNAFSDCSSLVSISIPEGTISLGVGVFSGCNSLANVNLPNTIKSIGKFAFEGCTSLESIDIPEGITEINSYVFNECSQLSIVKLPESLRSIEGSAFSYCGQLNRIVIP